MNTLKSILAGLAGTTFFIVFSILALFSLPLNVLAMMHIWGMSWWGALMGAIFVNVIPGIGQIAYAVFTVLGAYYYYAADFDWHAAAYPEIQSFDLTKLTPDEFSKYKHERIIPQLRDSCLKEGRDRYGMDGKVPTNVAAFCSCLSETIEPYITPQNALSTESDEKTRQLLTQAVRLRCAPR